MQNLKTVHVVIRWGYKNFMTFSYDYKVNLGWLFLHICKHKII